MDGIIGTLVIVAINLVVFITPAPIIDRQHVVPEYGAGWLEGTAWVTEGRWRTVLAGHTPGDFGRLSELRPGDTIQVLAQNGTYTYEVTEMRYVRSSEWKHLAATREPTLTLITCTSLPDIRLVINAALIRQPG